MESKTTPTRQESYLIRVVHFPVAVSDDHCSPSGPDDDGTCSVVGRLIRIICLTSSLGFLVLLFYHALVTLFRG
jgi:hypothetical protein